MYPLEIHYFTSEGLLVSSLYNHHVPGDQPAAVREYVLGLTPPNKFNLPIAYCYVRPGKSDPMLILMGGAR